MGLIHSPSIITDGLVLALDAQNSRSYPGSGTTWTDITYRGNNGTLTNGPTFEPGGPFAGSAGGSVAFDGTGDYLSIADNSALQMGSGDFTIEFWIYLNSLSGNPTPIDKAYTGSGVSNTGYLLQYSSSALKFYGGITLTSSTTDTTGVWIHYALTRNSGTTTLYRNGVSVASGSDATNYTYNTTLGIGANVLAGAGFGAGAGAINGYISNLRIVKGTALYTSAFTPPTKPLLPVTNTSLLTCQGGAIVDNSSNKFAITRNGDARAVKTASIKFDGSNDGASLPGTDLSLNQMTISSWNYSSGYSQQGFMFEKTTNGTVNTQYSLFFDTGPTLIYRTQGLSTTDLSINATTAGVVNNKWNNIVATFDGTNKRIYVNGVLATTSANLTGTVTANSTGAAYIGIYGSFGGYAFNGSIANTTIYNRALTAAEVSQNFNAMRNRFGI